MIIQIDQSGKIEKTNKPTVVGFSNSKSCAVIISSKEKLALKKHFRSANKRRKYIYQSFAAMIFILLSESQPIDLVVIDTEYPGQESLIKGFLLELFKQNGFTEFTKSTISFSQVGKSSPAHRVAHDGYVGKTNPKVVTAKDIISVINKKSGY